MPICYFLTRPPPSSKKRLFPKLFWQQETNYRKENLGNMLFSPPGIYAASFGSFRGSKTPPFWGVWVLGYGGKMFMVNG